MQRHPSTQRCGHSVVFMQEVYYQQDVLQDTGCMLPRASRSGSHAWVCRRKGPCLYDYALGHTPKPWEPRRLRRKTALPLRTCSGGGCSVGGTPRLPPAESGPHSVAVLWCPQLWLRGMPATGASQGAEVHFREGRGTTSGASASVPTLLTERRLESPALHTAGAMFPCLQPSLLRRLGSHPTLPRPVHL